MNFDDSMHAGQCSNSECHVHYEPSRGYFTVRNGKFGEFLSYGSPSCGRHNGEIVLMTFVIENGAPVLACPIEGCRKRIPVSEADLSRIDTAHRELSRHGTILT